MSPSKTYIWVDHYTSTSKQGPFTQNIFKRYSKAYDTKVHKELNEFGGQKKNESTLRVSATLNNSIFAPLILVKISNN